MSRKTLGLEAAVKKQVGRQFQSFSTERYKTRVYQDAQGTLVQLRLARLTQMKGYEGWHVNGGKLAQGVKGVLLGLFVRDSLLAVLLFNAGKLKKHSFLARHRLDLLPRDCFVYVKGGVL